MRFSSFLTVAVATVPFIAVLSNAAVVASADDNNNNYLDVSQQRSARAMADVSPLAAANNGNWAMMTRIADECAKDVDTAACVAVKAAVALERAARAAGDLQLLPGVTVTKNENGPAASTRDSRALPTEEELRGQLSNNNNIPEDAEDDRATKVTDMVIRSAIRFLQSRTLKFNFPQTDADELARSIEEGRGKLKKKVLPILGLLAVKIVAILPILLGIIGFFALKALVFGKLALLIAGVMAFQKYAGSAGGSGFGKIAADTWGTANAANAWSAPAAPSTNGGYYRRSMEAAAQQMAYNGQMQPSAQTVA